MMPDPMSQVACSTQSTSTPERSKNNAKQLRRSPRTPTVQNTQAETVLTSDSDVADDEDTKSDRRESRDALRVQTTNPRRSAASPSPISSNKTKKPTPPISSMRLERNAASDPGPSASSAQQDPQNSNVSPQFRARLPCGRSPYVSPTGKCHQNHLKICTKCQNSSLDTRESRDELNEQTPSKRPVSAPSVISIDDDDESEPESDRDSDELSTHNTRRFPRLVRQEQAKKRASPLVWELHANLQNTARKPLCKTERKGYIYFLRTPSKPGLLKIGISIDTPRRRKQHERSCALDTEPAAHPIAVSHAKRADQLLKLDMRHLQKKWVCSCNHEHGEWFQIDVDEACRVAKRWTDWINHKSPYDLQGDLKRSWADAIFYKTPSADIADPSHGKRWDHWAALLSQLMPAADDHTAQTESVRRYAAGHIPSTHTLAHRTRDSNHSQNAITTSDQIAGRAASAIGGQLSHSGVHISGNTNINLFLRRESLLTEL
ncbi:unnamed protein product [Periconia digitata]|uniref:Bacteriophage T5 Orf172 DNA-binding domain-containing protein n=1 Tax=Periconia digitata TaxID=1303443 RepID=A0A9W4UV04_9PLEO|nr:unnamed protein product [Periconia digitata]